MYIQMSTTFKLDGNLGLGITELGIFAGLIMFGILVLQVYMYFLYSADRTAVKYLVRNMFTSLYCIYLPPIKVTAVLYVCLKFPTCLRSI
jgi:hypothetical protein